MSTLFHCPDCHRYHADPYDATFVLSVRCADCGLTALLAATPALEMERAA